ncbi:Mini-ribonuclease 3 [Carboxydothermus pertinax]|uniref:Mini-ribonuclease 3 n=1 Tax=Carboxydothermus pertinax TaxID=870242 RepID=A0A1L8CW43_9THEO|nr:ribonuclease III domain-containing protein [Carboxydothermus pertinax]GAV23132.1 ribonuclease III [Carboxydothermus pertinax]
MEQKEYPPLALAYLGDAVYELLTREYVLAKYGGKMGDIHKKSVSMVNARQQALAVGLIEEHLTLEEREVYRRGRNAKGNYPRKVEVVAYRQSTGLEAVFGFLYLKGDIERIKELFSLITQLLESQGETI